MGSNYIQLPPNSTGLKVDTSELTVSANTVQRENNTISDPSTAAAIAAVENAQPGSSDYGLVVRNVQGYVSAPVRVDPTGTTVQPVTIGRVSQAPASPTAATVGVTSASAVASNSSRTGLVLTNTSGNVISLGFGAAAVLSSGITLFPNGTFVMDQFTFYTGAINAIASVASSNLAIQEFS